MPPKKNKKNAITFFIETAIIPEKQREGYRFMNGIAALIPEASQRFRVSIFFHTYAIAVSICPLIPYIPHFA